MGVYETRGKLKNQFYILMKQNLNLFLLKNNMVFHFAPENFMSI
jgi:hypothetical protein